MEKIKYYLWQDENSDFYVTDYKVTIKSKGLVHIDGQGYIKAKLILESKVKTDCILQAMTMQGQL